MRLPKICFLLANFLIASCTASSTPQNSSVPVPVSSSPSPSIEAQSPKPTPSIVSPEITDVFELDDIDPALIGKKAKLKLHFKSQSSRNCRFEMKYPQISGLADSEWQTQLNEILRQEMMEKMGASGSSELITQGDRCQKIAQKPGELYTRTRLCKVYFSEERLVSLSCLSLTFPGAYPNPRQHFMTFDLATGKVYQFADLFKPNSNFSVRLAVAMRDALWEETGIDYISFPFKELETEPSRLSAR